MKNILFAALLLFSFSLYSQNNPELSYLKITQKNCIKKRGNSLVLKEVLSDSRCPIGVNCIWAGEVKVLISVYQDRKFVKEETLTISDRNNQQNIAWFAQYLPEDKRNLQSINVVPQPKEGVKIKPKNYSIRLGFIK